MLYSHHESVFSIVLISLLNFLFLISQLLLFFISCHHILSHLIINHCWYLWIIVYSCLISFNLQHEESNWQCCQAIYTAGHHIPQHTSRTRTPYFRHTGTYHTGLYRTSHSSSFKWNKDICTDRYLSLCVIDYSLDFSCWLDSILCSPSITYSHTHMHTHTRWYLNSSCYSHHTH